MECPVCLVAYEGRGKVCSAKCRAKAARSRATAIESGKCVIEIELSDDAIAVFRAKAKAKAETINAYIATYLQRAAEAAAKDLTGAESKGASLKKAVAREVVSSQTRRLQTQTFEDSSNCKHPTARRIGDYCPVCNLTVGKK